MTKTGQDHLDSLRDGRSVYLNGQLVGDVVDHPAYRNAIRSTAGLYDFQAASENRELM
ncbi:MAG: 4-hydroxyphenylacetate 3-monooxygenase, partial [Dehalococcoidia bacterium]|nr:4-hydroxyphenylacetate 3-monooxygenase [Dehalococcoidia bacterium]